MVMGSQVYPFKSQLESSLTGLQDKDPGAGHLPLCPLSVSACEACRMLGCPGMPVCSAWDAVHADEKLGTFAGHPSCALKSVAFRIPGRPQTASLEAPMGSAQHTYEGVRNAEKQRDFISAS